MQRTSSFCCNAFKPVPSIIFETTNIKSSKMENDHNADKTKKKKFKRIQKMAKCGIWHGMAWSVCNISRHYNDNNVQKMNNTCANYRIIDKPVRCCLLLSWSTTTTATIAPILFVVIAERKKNVHIAICIWNAFGDANSLSMPICWELLLPLRLLLSCCAH